MTRQDNTDQATAAREAMTRLAPPFMTRYNDQIILELTDAATDNYSFHSDHGQLKLSGNSTLSLVTGFSRYLTETNCGHINRCGSWLDVPDTLPLPSRTISGHTKHRYRVVNNFTVGGYTSAYWQWPQWEHEIDLIAASGINTALVTVGAEAIWFDTFTQFGFDESEVLQWISLPGHQPWQWMGNLTGQDESAMSVALLESRARLGQRVIERMKLLGIEVILPGFSGFVPDGFADRNAHSTVVSQGEWRGHNRPEWLDPSCESFAHVAEVFYRNQTQRFGSCRAQAVDVLHEGGHADALELTSAAAGLSRSMEAAHPDYLWVLQAWQGNPRPEMLDGVDKEHMLLLDLTGKAWRNSDGWGTAWAWGSLTNYGGRFGLFGGLSDIARFPSLITGNAATELAGTALMAEGLDTNPVLWSLFTEISWRDGGVDIEQWIDDYPQKRYGATNSQANRAWHGLLATAYRSSHGSPGGADSLLCAIPSLQASQASPASPHYLPYPPETLEVAWRDLLSARNQLKHINSYQYDLVDITRQVISNRARVLLPLLRAAYHSRDSARFDSLRNSFVELFEVLEPVLATRSEFLLGPWLASARELGSTAAESDRLEVEARTLITAWGNSRKHSSWLSDYANREWAGLLGTLYRRRWERFFATLADAIDKNQPPETVDFYQITHEWIHSGGDFATEPSGDPVAAARAVHHALPYFEGLP